MTERMGAALAALLMTAAFLGGLPAQAEPEPGQDLDLADLSIADGVASVKDLVLSVSICDGGALDTLRLVAGWTLDDPLAGAKRASFTMDVHAVNMVDGMPAVGRLLDSAAFRKDYTVPLLGHERDAGELVAEVEVPHAAEALVVSLAATLDTVGSTVLDDSHAGSTLIQFVCQVEVMDTLEKVGEGLDAFVLACGDHEGGPMLPTTYEDEVAGLSAYVVDLAGACSEVVLDAVGKAISASVGPACQVAEGALPMDARATCLAWVRKATDTANSTAALLMTAAGLGGGQADNAKGTATGANPDDELAPSGSRTLKTAEMDGSWKLSLVPSSAGVGGLTLVPGTTLPPGTYATIPLLLNDRGVVSQPTTYTGSNPAPNPSAHIYEEPPSAQDLWVAGAACFGAGAAALVGAVAIGLATGGIGTVGYGMFASWFFGTIGAGTACAIFWGMMEDVGRYAAKGAYENKWGASAPTSWLGKMLDVPGVVNITTKVQILDPVVVSAPYGNAVSEGFDEQKEKYERLDFDARKAAFSAHTQFREQKGSATAEISLNVPLVGTVMTTVGTQVHYLGSTYLGPLYYSTGAGGFLLGCGTVCSGSGIITITSPGTGVLTPSDTITLDFIGTTGAAVVSVLGLPLKGFTLDGQLGGQSASPAEALTGAVLEMT